MHTKYTHKVDTQNTQSHSTHREYTFKLNTDSRYTKYTQKVHTYIQNTHTYYLNIVHTYKDTQSKHTRTHTYIYIPTHT